MEVSLMMSFSATFLVYPGRKQEVVRILLDHVEQAKKEPGVIVTHVYRSRTDPRRFFIYHELTDQAAFDAHRATQHYGTHILTYLYGMFEPESLDMDTYDPLSSGDVQNS
jgi:(4S)-4-hydroxy-5-phosphonooxypentane-2,3-dione isomerase